MPTYLTPGVYVEEVPSTSKPIEGVGTSIAAFVGLAPGGPVNTPMRIANWTQFSKIFGDPNEPDNGPFMEPKELLQLSSKRVFQMRIDAGVTFPSKLGAELL